MTISFRPARRVNTPLIIGLSGPTKSGKTKSAHRLARGLAQDKPVAMINTEGPKGHQYSDEFQYLTADLHAPYQPDRYTEALQAALALDPKPGVVIIDSVSHMHDGSGGLLEWHDAELDRLAGENQAKRQRMTWTAWIKPKAAENRFIYAMAEADCHLILCFRAKPKLKIVKGQDPVDLGLQPIAGERVAFETLVTLMFQPHSKGVPDMDASELREPFDTLIPRGEQLSEQTGRQLAEWSAGSQPPAHASPWSTETRAEVAGLADQLLELAEQRGTDRAVKDAIDRNYAAHRDDPEAHVAWLRAQIDKTRSRLEAQERATA